MFLSFTIFNSENSISYRTLIKLHLPRNLILARRPVLTGIATTLVHILIAGLAGITRRTNTLERVDFIVTRGVVLAWSAEAFVDVEVAVLAGETWSAEALVAADTVHADAVHAERVTR